MIFSEGNREKVKKLPGYGGRYQVGSMGHVFSNGEVLSLIGERYVNLSEKGVATRVDVAYLVARLFVGNLHGYDYVRHKNGDLRDNRAENLEWVREKPKTRGGRKPYGGRAVAQYTLDGTCVGRYESISEASEKSGVARSLIRNCAGGLAKRARGFIFRYV